MLFYRTVRLAFRAIAAPAFRFRVEGTEHVPARGPGVIVAPHRSWLDPACVGGACPRPVRFLIMERVWRVAWAHWFFRGMRALPIDPGGADSLPALRQALRLLQSGELIGVFPEGRIVTGGDLGPVRRGAALLSVRGGAPVIPMVIRGSARAWPHGRRWPGPAAVRVCIGPALVPPERGGRVALHEMMERITAALDALEREEPSR